MCEFDSLVKTMIESCLRDQVAAEKSREPLERFLKNLNSKTSAPKNLNFKQVTVVGLMVLILSLAFICGSDRIGRVGEAVVRLAAIQFLPWFDWTTLYYSQCIWKNRAFGLSTSRIENCLSCEVHDAVSVWENADIENVSDALNFRVPFIISGGLDEWKPVKDLDFGISTIVDSFVDVMKTNGGPVVCKLMTNLKSNRFEFIDAAKAATKNAITPWFMHWENCETPEIKTLRKFYSRLSVFPLSLDLSDTNWVFISSMYFSRVYKDVPFSSTFFVLTQVKGEMDLRLTPVKSCSEVCQEIHLTLRKNQTLVVSGELWQLGYLTNPYGDENVAFGISGYLDSN